MDKSDFKKISLLYVEDDEDIRNELVEVLELEFENLYVGKDGQEGLDLYKEHRPDIVVSDISMPVMNGLDMCGHIRSINPDVPIIITTAFNEPSFLIKAIDIGVDKYVLKPIDLRKLEETLLRCSKFVFQNKIIKDLLDLSKHLMDKNDNFIFTSGDDFNYINKPFLNFLGFDTIEEFHKNENCVFQKLQELTKEEVCQTKKEWVKFLKSNIDKEHVIYLKECVHDEERVIPYKVNVQHYDEIEHYLISLHELNKK